MRSGVRVRTRHHHAGLRVHSARNAESLACGAGRVRGDCSARVLGVSYVGDSIWGSFAAGLAGLRLRHHRARGGLRAGIGGAHEPGHLSRRAATRSDVRAAHRLLRSGAMRGSHSRLRRHVVVSAAEQDHSRPRLHAAPDTRRAGHVRGGGDDGSAVPALLRGVVSSARVSAAGAARPSVACEVRSADRRSRPIRGSAVGDVVEPGAIAGTRLDIRMLERPLGVLVRAVAGLEHGRVAVQSGVCGPTPAGAHARGLATASEERRVLNAADSFAL